MHRKNKKAIFVNKQKCTLFLTIKSAFHAEAEQNEQIRKYFLGVVNAGDTEANRKYRHNLLTDLIEPLCIPRDPKRLFSDTEKQFLWHKSPEKICGICNTVIDKYINCEIDHIIAWDKGGRTDLSNGQISHTECNRRKG